MTTDTSPAATEDAEQLDAKLAVGELRSCIFGMGCFWGPDARFGALDGVRRTRVGYAGGTTSEPTYRAIADHAEAIRVDFDPQRVQYTTLFESFRSWYRPGPAYKGQYRALVVCFDDEQSALVQAFLDTLAPAQRPQTSRASEPDGRFWSAEAYHQKYRLRRHEPAVKALERRFGERWDESSLATSLNGIELPELERMDWTSAA